MRTNRRNFIKFVVSAPILTISPTFSLLFSWPAQASVASGVGIALQVASFAMGGRGGSILHHQYQLLREISRQLTRIELGLQAIIAEIHLLEQFIDDRFNVATENRYREQVFGTYRLFLDEILLRKSERQSSQAYDEKRFWSRIWGYYEEMRKIRSRLATRSASPSSALTMCMAQKAEIDLAGVLLEDDNHSHTISVEEIDISLDNYYQYFLSTTSILSETYRAKNEVKNKALKASRKTKPGEITKNEVGRYPYYRARTYGYCIPRSFPSTIFKDPLSKTKYSNEKNKCMRDRDRCCSHILEMYRSIDLSKANINIDVDDSMDSALKSWKPTINGYLVASPIEMQRQLTRIEDYFLEKRRSPNKHHIGADAKLSQPANLPKEHYAEIVFDTKDNRYIEGKEHFWRNKNQWRSRISPYIKNEDDMVVRRLTTFSEIDRMEEEYVKWLKLLDKAATIIHEIAYVEATQLAVVQAIKLNRAIRHPSHQS